MDVDLRTYCTSAALIDRAPPVLVRNSTSSAPGTCIAYNESDDDAGGKQAIIDQSLPCSRYLLQE